jgi:outer membrane protein assembly factor BamB
MTLKQWAVRGLTAAALVAASVTSLGGRFAGASGSDQAVAYQNDAAHDGNQADTLSPPLSRVWSINLGGPVSYPLIAGGDVYVTAGPSGNYLYALSEATGAVAWGPIDLGGVSWLAYDGGQVFAQNSAGFLRSFAASTGAAGWTTQLPGQTMFTSPPTAANGIVYTGGAGSGGTVYAVNESTGTVLWVAPVMNGDHSAPVVTANGVYVAYACQQTYDFNPSTGALIWHHTSSCEGGGGKTAAYANGQLYVRDPILGNVILDGSTGGAIGAFSAGPAPALSGSTGFFLANGTLTAENLTTNAVLWSFSGDGSLDTAPVAANGYVYVGSSSGNLYAVNASSGQQVWVGNAGQPITAPDEQNVAVLTGMGVGGGDLLVAASNTLVAYATGPTPTTSYVSASANPVVVSQPVTFTATVTGATNTATPTGTVTFSDGSTALGTVPVSANMAKLTTSSLAVGTHTISASYSGDAANQPSSATISETVSKAASTTALATSAGTVRKRSPVTFTATVSISPSTVAPASADTVSFFDSSTALGTVTLSANTAKLTTSNLAVGTHTITAVYNGDPDIASSTSPALTETVKG